MLLSAFSESKTDQHSPAQAGKTHLTHDPFRRNPDEHRHDAGINHPLPRVLILSTFPRLVFLRRLHAPLSNGWRRRPQLDGIKPTSLSFVPSFPPFKTSCNNQGKFRELDRADRLRDNKHRTFRPGERPIKQTRILVGRVRSPYGQMGR